MKDKSQLDLEALSTLSGRPMPNAESELMGCLICSAAVGFLKSRRPSVVIGDRFYLGNRALDPANKRTGLRYRM